MSQSQRADTIESERLLGGSRATQLASALISTKAFRRLRYIRFLGAIDYMLVRVPNGVLRNIRHTRYGHSIGVANLAMRYAARVNLDDEKSNLACAAALLHDIGHAPLSHTLEPVFREAFGIDHHRASTDIISGRVKIGLEVNEVLRTFGVDPDHVVAVLAGKDDPCSGFFSGPINFDTIEGIMRTRRYFTRAISGLTSCRVIVAATDRSGHDDEEAVDEFWKQKDEVYTRIIRSHDGILADHLCQSLARRHILRLKEADYFSTEASIFRKLPEVKDVLGRELGDGLDKHHVETPKSYIARRFYVDCNMGFRERDDFARYRQKKSLRAFTTTTAVGCAAAMSTQLDMLKVAGA